MRLAGESFVIHDSLLGTVTLTGIPVLSFPDFTVGFLTEKQMMQDEERRRFMRLTAETEATVIHLKTQRSAQVKLHDLSAIGCAFIADLNLQLDEELEFVVQGTNDRIEPLRRRAKVVRLNDGPDQMTAVEFIDL
jgi:hypothetical protein